MDVNCCISVYKPGRLEAIFIGFQDIIASLTPASPIGESTPHHIGEGKPKAGVRQKNKRHMAAYKV
jgi:hypothetical protein